MELNFIKISFSLLTFTVIIGGSLVNLFEKFLPTFLIKSFRYGKFACKDKGFGSIDVPRRWFKHFYVFALIWSSLGLIACSIIYLKTGRSLPVADSILDLFVTSDRTARVSATSTYVAMILLTIQCWKRFYETYFINIFSNSIMNLAHYLVGYFHYFGAVIAILSEAPGFTLINPEFKAAVVISSLGWRDLLMSAIFLWATLNQLKACYILADLRKNKQGDVVTMKHSVPQGGLFEYVSSPHISCELLMYTALTIILWGNTTWLYIYFWVLSNQVETAFLTHWWYQETFKDYPKKRKALIPYML